MTYGYDDGLVRMKELVARFSNGISRYKNHTYDETSVRSEFIDKFFECFGWDVTNESGVLDEFKDVEKEYALSTEHVTKRPDYAFKYGGMVQFFVEAKKPSENIKENPKHASQLKKYAFNKNIPISILTDFEELGVYYCHRKPKATESPQVGRINYYTYEEYVEKFDELYKLFSKDSVLHGSIEKHAKTGSLTGTEPVNKTFLKDIQEWRKILAKDIISSNDLSVDELNYCVQKILDRILFLRICEDRSMEIYESLKSVTSGNDSYDMLCDLFDDADSKYNSGLFNFTTDKLTKTIKIKDATIQNIIKSLYPPISPYDFSVMSVDILGQVYEEFLGQTISFTKSKHIRIIDKPETKIAGGVFYTPEFVVEYIINNTVGSMIRNKSPAQIKDIHIIDPACGSGTFLVRAYSALLNRHLKYYTDRISGNKHPKEIYKRKDGKWFLTTKIRKEILLNNIYGLDVDTYAVEITKLSLLLKVLENESNETVNKQMKLFKQKALPDLDKNILCGNALIDYSISNDITDDYIKKIRPFDWKVGFGDILESGGFNVVIGNPPYVRVQRMDEIQRDYFTKRYHVPSGTYDLYSLFLEVGLGDLLGNDGLMCFILPHKFFTGNSGKNLRKYISDNMAIKEIIHFGTNQVFDNATTYTCILSLTGKNNKLFHYKRFNLGDNFKNLTGLEFTKLYNSDFGESDWIFNTADTSRIIKKIQGQKNSFEDITYRIFKGSSTGNDGVFVLEGKLKGKIVQIYSKASKGMVKIERDILHPFVHGEDVRKYLPEKTSKFLLFPYYINKERWEVIPDDVLCKTHPHTYAYLKSHKKTLRGRKDITKSDEFYKYSAARSLPYYRHPKIMIPDMLVSNRIGIDDIGTIYHNANIHSVVFRDVDADLFYYLGVLNSKLFWFFIKNTTTSISGDAHRLLPQSLKKFAFPEITGKNKNQHDMISENVKKIISLMEYTKNSKLEQDKNMYRMNIRQIEKENDDIICDMYGVSVSMVE